MRSRNEFVYQALFIVFFFSFVVTATLCSLVVISKNETQQEICHYLTQKKEFKVCYLEKVSQFKTTKEAMRMCLPVKNLICEEKFVTGK